MDASPRTLEQELAELEAAADARHDAYVAAVHAHNRLLFGESAELQQLRKEPFRYQAALQAAEAAIVDTRRVADAATVAVSRHLEGWAARKGERPGPFAQSEAEAARLRQERLAGDLRGLGVPVGEVLHG